VEKDSFVDRESFFRYQGDDVFVKFYKPNKEKGEIWMRVVDLREKVATLKK
jgi:hypothetical protein